ncbi:MAG: 2-hydroxyacyl-CoA dehydratase [Actinomycetota bacterium]|nr:2-hydroxyacyl-CoA dehydratase [Actinomycetota bacterium]
MNDNGKMDADKERRKIKSAAAMRELMTKYYMEAKAAEDTNRPVAWITSGGPVEPLIHFDIIPVYPENHGAMCGAAHMNVELCEVAESKGFSRDVCSYARGDIGSAITKGGPIGGLPRPDLLVCCNNICNTVFKWYEELARYFDVPLFIYDTPFVRGDLPEHIAKYSMRQMEEYFSFLERVTGREFDEGSFLEVAAKSLQAINLWSEVLDCNRSRPAPMTCFDCFILMAPIVTLRGTQEVVDFYQGVLEEMHSRVEEGIGILPFERHRLLWDNIPIWYEMRNLGKLFMELESCLVVDTYTTAWTFEGVDVERPIESLAEAYAEVYLNINLERMTDTIVNLAERFEVDGMVLHSNRSCKPYSLGQYDLAREFTRRTGHPTLILEADHTDSRWYNRGEVETRIRDFVENLLD